MSVGRICIRSVDVADMNESASVVASRMHARNVGTLVVVDSDQRPLGIVTDRDLTVRVIAECRDPLQTTVGQIMSRLPRMVREEAPIEEALGIMRCGPYRRLPVVDRDRRLVGLLSLDDILDLLAEDFGQIGKILEKESPASLSTA
jgi:CBS domain-containing protein